MASSSLSHLNFDTINLLSKNDIVVGLPKLKFIKDHLCSYCELGKAKRKSFHSKLTPSSKRQLHLLHMDLCGPMCVPSINRKRYVLVIVDDYSRYTWTHFLRSKDETPEVLIDFLRLVQRGLQAQVRVNDVVERQNRTLVEAARTMLSAAKVPLLFWAEAIATACFTQNRSLVIPRHEKTPYHITNDRKPSVINMPRAIIGDTSRTKSYIPKVSEIPGFSPILAQFYKHIENLCIHEGRVVDKLYYKSNRIERLFTNIRLNCLFEINEPIVP
nr:hypothetical protein [Tanacetum cinerariifolium]